jgi:hypothetical protein
VLAWHHHRREVDGNQKGGDSLRLAIENCFNFPYFQKISISISKKFQKNLTKGLIGIKLYDYKTFLVNWSNT